MIEPTDAPPGLLPPGEHGTAPKVKDPAVDPEQKHMVPGELLVSVFRRPMQVIIVRKASLKRWLPVMVSFLRSRPMRFLYAFAVLNTILYAKIVTGEYRLPLSNNMLQALYVLFGSLAVSSLFYRLKPWKAVTWALGILGAPAVMLLFAPPLITLSAQKAILSFLSGESFGFVDIICYGIGAAIALFILRMLKSDSTRGNTGTFNSK